MYLHEHSEQYRELNIAQSKRDITRPCISIINLDDKEFKTEKTVAFHRIKFDMLQKANDGT